MSDVILVEAQPWAPDGTPIAVRLAGGGSRGYTHRGYVDWLPGVASKPRFTAQIGFNVAEGGFTGGAVPTTGALAFLPGDPAVMAALAQLVWTDAPITVRVGDDDLADPVWTTLLTGTVAGMVVRQGQASFTIADLSRDLAKPLLTDRFAGTGGLEGIAEAKERIKRRSWGRCWNVEARILDKANSIYELSDPTRPLLAIDAVKDKGRAADQVTVLGWQGSAPATFAALQAAQAPAGGAVVAPSIACVKWWTQPVGPLTADLRGEIGLGYVEACAAIAARVIAARAPTMAITGLEEAIAARPGACGLHVDQDSETAGQALDRLLLGASLLWIVEPSGAVRLAPIAFTGPVETLVAIEAEREAVYKPVTERLLGYQRNQRQHSDGELSAVFQASDGTYRDGTPIEDLKPAERGATLGAITGGNLVSGYGRGILTDDGIFTPIGYSLGFAGEGALARLNVVDWSSRVAGRPQNIQNLVLRSRFDDAQTGLWQGWTEATSGAHFQRCLVFDFVDSYEVDNWFAVTPGERLFGSAYLNTGATNYTCAFGLMLQRADGSVHGWLQFGSRLAGQANWARVAGAIEIPQGVTLARPWLLHDNRALAPGNWARAADMQITRAELGATVGAITGGNLQSGYGRGILTDDGIFTPIGYSLGFAGEGALARRNSADWSTQVLGTGKPADYATVGAITGGNLQSGYGRGILTDDGIFTPIGYSLGFAGEGALARQNNVTFGTQITGLPTPIQPGNFIGGLYLDARQVQYWGGPLIQALMPGEAGANVTEGRYSLGFAGEGVLARRNFADWSSQVLGTGKPADYATVGAITGGNLQSGYGRGILTDDGIFTPIGYSLGFAGEGALARLNVVDWSSRVAGRPQNIQNLVLRSRFDDAQTGLWQGWTEATGGAHFQRCLVFDFVDSYEVDNWFAVTPGERLFGSAYLNTGATNYTCAFGLMLQRADGSIHGWLQFGSRLAGQANWARVAGAIEIPQGVTLARPWLLHDNRALAPGNWARAGDMQITRAELGATVGAITGNNLISGYGRGVMTDDGIFTPIGYSLGFVGEGAGARANSLAQLDPTAASQLAAVAGGGIQVAALYGTIRKVMAPDASLNFDAAAGIEAGGNSGNVRVVIQVSPAGAESWSDIAVGFEQFVSASEPAFVTAAGGFTNSTGVQQVYEFRAIERRTPGSAGGAVVAAQSFLRG